MIKKQCQFPINGLITKLSEIKRAREIISVNSTL
nr:MAG TPA: hypothetical protein [Caudoviricetes sp.]